MQQGDSIELAFYRKERKNIRGSQTVKCEQRPSVQEADAAEITKCQSGWNRKIASRPIFDILKMVYGQILGRVSRSVKKMSGRIALSGTHCPGAS